MDYVYFKQSTITDVNDSNDGDVTVRLEFQMHYGSKQKSLNIENDVGD